MANITPLTVSGTWSTFGTLATTVNEIISRANAFGENTNVYITGGTVDGVEIGGVSPNDGTFNSVVINTSLDLTGATLTIDDNSISGDKISGGTITVNYVELSHTPTSSNHATTKTYVDDIQTELEERILAYSMILGE